MRHFLLFLLAFSVFADYEIPVIENAKDSLVHPQFGDEQYSSVWTGNNEPDLSYSQNIGDFDGDGSDDIFIEWLTEVYHYTKAGERIMDSGPGFDPYPWVFNRFHVGIYSITKKKYLFSHMYRRAVDGNVISGDFDNDNKIDFVIGNTVYFGVNSLAKKKVFP